MHSTSNLDSAMLMDTVSVCPIRSDSNPLVTDITLRFNDLVSYQVVWRHCRIKIFSSDALPRFLLADIARRRQPNPLLITGGKDHWPGVGVARATMSARMHCARVA